MTDKLTSGKLPDGKEVTVIAPSRLHFGMFSFGVPESRQFGGVGVMIDQPVTSLRIEPASVDECVGTHAQRLRQTLEIVRRSAWGSAVPPCRLSLRAAPRSHVGLGSGTQTALAVVAGLRAFAKLPPLDALELGETSGRAKRSSVGLHGFLNGGLIVEAGKLPQEKVAPLLAQTAVPGNWRFVLICPRHKEGLSGETERAAFAALPPVPTAITEELQRIALDQLVPAARHSDFATFAEGLYRFGLAAGQCFKSHQAGVYATEQLARLVERVRGAGVRGVGQSSWGPTLFSLHPSVDAAERFLDDRTLWPDAYEYDFTIARPSPAGADIHTV
ncbi:MAG: beta-RFAP synthase [Planctomycetia bacterium]|nr:beta-RFAP synthase [Planctomycetia bacterium]